MAESNSKYKCNGNSEYGGPSTALPAKCASSSAQDDKFVEGARGYPGRTLAMGRGLTMVPPN